MREVAEVGWHWMREVAGIAWGIFPPSVSDFKNRQDNLDQCLTQLEIIRRTFWYLREKFDTPSRQFRHSKRVVRYNTCLSNAFRKYKMELYSVVLETFTRVSIPHWNPWSGRGIRSMSTFFRPQKSLTRFQTKAMLRLLRIRNKPATTISCAFFDFRNKKAC